jgi:hypothetical protein
MAALDATFHVADSEEMHFTWETLTTTNLSGVPVDISKYNDKHVTLYGTWDTSTITLQGTGDPRGNPKHTDHSNAAWITLPDPQGTAIAPTQNAGEQILDNPKWIRPLMSSAGASSDVDVTITAIRSR